MPSLKRLAVLGSAVLALCVCASTAAEDLVVLTTGDSLRGEIIEQTETHLVLMHPVLGKLTIPAEAVASVSHDVQTLAEAPSASAEVEVSTTEASAPPAEESPMETPAEPAKPESQWKSRFDVGVTGSAGTSEDANLRMALKSTWTRPLNVITFDSSFLLSTTNGDRTENRFTAGVHSEWPRPDSRWSYFLQARYDYDEFNSWVSRVTGGGGVAYRLIDIEEPIEGTDHMRVIQLKLRAGAGVAREFGSTNKDLQPEAILGADLLWKINSWQDLVAGTTLYPNLSDGEYRIVSNAEWVIRLRDGDAMNLKLGVAHEYQSRTDSGVSPNDLSVYAALGIDF